MARILVLDDSALVLSATRLALESDGHQVFTVDEPAAFFTALTKESPALALVDVSMPAMEGDAVVWIARAHQLRACQIVLYSAKAAGELERLVSASGADGYICKSDGEEVLRQRVVEFLKQEPKPSPGAPPG